jgi:hypothetical protein
MRCLPLLASYSEADPNLGFHSKGRGFVPVRSYRTTSIRAELATLTMIEHLEPRRLFSLASGVPDLTLPEVPGPRYEIVNMEWDGRIVEVARGGWSVLLEGPEQTIDPETGEVDHHFVFVSGEAPSEALAAELAQAAAALGTTLGDGLKFGRYVGVEQAFTVQVADGYTPEQILAAFAAIDGFVEASPTSVVYLLDSEPVGNADPIEFYPLTIDDAPADSDPAAEAGITSEPGDGLDLVEMEWNGLIVKAVRGEWVVSLARPEPTFDPETGEWHQEFRFKTGDVPADALAADLADAAAALGTTLGDRLQFDRYLGVEYSFTVRVADDITAEQLLAALATMDGLIAVEPSLVGYRCGVDGGEPLVPVEDGATGDTPVGLGPIAESGITVGAPAMRRGFAISEIPLDRLHGRFDDLLWRTPAMPLPTDGDDADATPAADVLT